MDKLLKNKKYKKNILIILVFSTLSFLIVSFFYFQFKNNVSTIVCEMDKARIEHRWINVSNNYYYVTQDTKKDYQNLIIDDNLKKLARFESGSKNIIQGDYKVFSKNKIEVIETRNVGKGTVVAIFLIDRVSGRAEFYAEDRRVDKNTNIVGGVSKIRFYGICQKLKDNTL
jgi:hypothetical protein